MHEVGYFEKPVFEMHEFPEHLACRDHDIGFLDFPESASNRGHGAFGKVISGRVIPQSNLQLFSQPNFMPGILGRLLAAVMFPFFFCKVLKSFRPDIVVSYAVPTSGWQALIICKALRIPYLFRAIDVSHKIRKSAFAPLIKIAERVVYRNADWISCNNPAMRSYCTDLGAHLSNTSVDLPPLDMTHFLNTNLDSQETRASLGLTTDRPVILYMGSFFYFSGLDKVIASLHQSLDRPLLLLVGGGEQDDYLRSMVQRLGLEDRVRFTGFVSFSELPKYLALADVAINPMEPSLVAHSALPNKVLQYMATGLPVVSTNLRGLSSLFEDAPGIRMVDRPEDVLATAVSMAGEPNVPELGRLNRALVEATFRLEGSVMAFVGRILDVGGKP